MNGRSRTCVRFGAGLRQSIHPQLNRSLPPPTPSAVGASLRASGLWGDGMLTYQGKTRAFQVHGLSAAGVGTGTSRGTAEVHRLP